MKAPMFIALLAGFSFGGDAGLAVQSAIVPGMGQIAAGRGDIAHPNTWKGLALMGGLVFSAHQAIQYLSLQESYAEETQVRAREREEAEFFQDKKLIDEQWERAYGNYEDARKWALVFSGLTVGVYAYGIVDALLFTTPSKARSSALAPAPKTELRFARYSRVSGAEVLYRF